ncbi:MAG TPA: biotin/lipoyl-binding protein, partial [Planctomycetaceae bacterium]
MITKPAENPWETDTNGAPQTQPPPEDRLGPPPPVGLPEDRATPALRRHGLSWVLMIAIAAGAWFSRQQWLPWVASILPKAAAPTAKADRPIPVRTAVVQRRDIPLFINGLGTVTSFKTVTIRSRVDGEVLKVAFDEGQMVREGDLLAEIDPRLFKAQLQQA